MKKLKLKFFWQQGKKRISSLPSWLFYVFFLLLFLRLPSLFEPYWYGDEGIYLVLGQGIRRGLVLYRDIYDNKPPLIYLLAAIAGNVSWFRFILLVWMVATVYSFFLLVKKLFPRQQKLPLILSFLFVLLTSIPMFEGNIANAEIFFIGFVQLGFLFFLREKFFKAGLFYGLAFLFKMPPLFDFLSLIFFLFLSFLEDSRKRKIFIKNISSLILGFGLPFLFTIFYYISKKSFLYYIKATFLENIPYLSSWEGGGGNILKSGLFWRGMFLLAFLGFIFWQRKKLLSLPLFLLSSCWLGFSLFGALLSGRPYPHYLLQVTIPLLLTGGFLVKEASVLFKEKVFLGLLLPLFLLPLAFKVYHFYTYPTWSYYKNFVQFVIGKKSRADYYRYFDGRVERNYQLAKFIKATVPVEEKIFIWGNEPCLYALSRRLPVGRYTAAYHIIDHDAFSEVLAAMEKHPPRLVILVPFDRPFPFLKPFLKSYYLLVEKEGGVQLWYRYLSN